MKHLPLRPEVIDQLTDWLFGNSILITSLGFNLGVLAARGYRSSTSNSKLIFCTWVRIFSEMPRGNYLSGELKTVLCSSSQNSSCLRMKRVPQKKIWDQLNWNVEVRSLEPSKEARIPRGVTMQQWAIDSAHEDEAVRDQQGPAGESMQWGRG